jgi:tRNA A-37 threonylcarbamoyl transferase component Bud32
MADWVGKTLGKVHIDKLVARGGMAEVYRGNHEMLGRVAIKVMRGLLDTDSEHLSRFQREAEVVAGLKHPNIVQMLEYAVAEETPCLIMDYVQGPSLASYLKILHEQKQRMPIGVVASLLRSIASALDYAHSKGIVHRDIKPANVLLRSPSQDIELDQPLPLDVEPILTDFGLVRLLDSTMHTTTGSVSGTPAYMSPEQSRGEKVDKRTDIYSLGVMLYEMLAGGVPFQADTTFGMLMKHINEPPPPIKGISDDLQALLDRALAKDPSLRYDSAGELANEFLAVFNGQTISPGTLHIAQMARQIAAEANKGRLERPSARWVRIGIEAVVVVALAVLLFLLIRPPTSGVSATPPPVDVNIPVGRVRFSDFNNVMDRVTIILNNPETPEPGTHLEAWLRNNETSIVRKIGTIRITSSGAGLLEFTDSNGGNLFGNFDEVFITVEDDDSTSATPPGSIAYSSRFPPQALVHVREVLVESSATPDNLAIMQGLYYYSASYIDISINGNALDPEYVGMVAAYENGDEGMLRKRMEEVINLIVGASSDIYRDYDNDGFFDTNDGDGYGSHPNGEQAGYLQAMIVNVKQVSDAEDSTPNMRLYSDSIQTCVQNMEGWTNQLLALALQLALTSFGPDMEPIIEEMSELSDRLLTGEDVNQDGLVEPIPGECGVNLAYEYGWYMADMSIFIGDDRIPPSGK